ncbi:hypothetical protein WJX73_009026 [Symbiochloris irregularis]|uniref:GrpE protein homolog n=1 Tax=Symbiochloris irregularis TaxID=706552 RepID=A0AAW1NU20_9CHLO
MLASRIRQVARGTGFHTSSLRTGLSLLQNSSAKFQLSNYSYPAAGRRASFASKPTGEAEPVVGSAADEEAAANRHAPHAGTSATTAHAHAAAEASSAAEAPNQKVAQLQEQLTQRDAMLLEKDGQIEEVTERSLRALADLENLRERSARQAETTRKFAVQGFAKSLLEVADNLERALSVSGVEQQQTSADTALTQLESLRGGLNLTQKILRQVFEQHGLSRFEALGENFDPNLHSALFEIPDPSKPAGTIATVTKAGYKLHDRVLRPAEVGVVRTHDAAAQNES